MEGKRTHTLDEIAALVGGRVIGDGAFRVSGIRSLEEATKEDISPFTDRRYLGVVQTTCAGALIVGKETPAFPRHQIVADRPDLACAKTAGLFIPQASGFEGIHGQSFIHESSRLGRDVTVHPGVYVGEDSVIGDRVVLYPGVFVGDRVRIGDETVVHPNVSILHDCSVGKAVILHAGTVIGADGFGFVRDGGRSVKIPQIGTVRIDDGVEVGANCAIDRGALGTTWIKRGVKMDNLIQIAHNVVVGEGTIIVAQTGVSGSVEIGRGVVVGGQVGIGDHVSVGDRAMIGSQSGVAKSIESGEMVSGTPAVPHRLWLKTSRLLTRLPVLNDRVRSLEKKVDALVRRLDGRA
ncbi:MAG: UDP-3-O-(3-hydroxymyristoyl)glucosamine N-acyltransferase [Deltaproteobacteria bacterium]|nr:UDP-3-O-(3-hydroxymyristoyl)glucosamine N-acyltransferase [Deltaproteobacteria bacterium]